MAHMFTPSDAKVVLVKEVQFGILSPDDIVGVFLFRLLYLPQSIGHSTSLVSLRSRCTIFVSRSTRRLQPLLLHEHQNHSIIELQIRFIIAIFSLTFARIGLGSFPSHPYPLSLTLSLSSTSHVEKVFGGKDRVSGDDG